MDKDLEKEYLEDLDHYDEGMGIHSTSYEKCKERLIRLAKIDNSNPSEALENLRQQAIAFEHSELAIKVANGNYNTIKQALLKSQEQEKEIAYIEKIKTMMKQKDCVLRYIESEDCFAVRTILSDGWYRLTPEFVENNVKEEIKPLPLVEKNKQLKEENAELKKVLEAIKKHFIIKFEEDEGDWDTTACANIVDYKEDFELLKRWLKNE